MNMVQIQLSGATEIFAKAAQSIRSLHEKYQSEEVRDQIDFMLQVYRSIALLYWTLTELQSLRRQQRVTDRIMAISSALSDTVKVVNLVSEFGTLAFSQGLLISPMSNLFLSLSK